MDANLKSRLATATLGVPLLVLFVGRSPTWFFAAVLFILTVAALREYFAMAFPGRPQDRCMGIFFGMFLSGTVFLSGTFDPVIWLNFVLLIGFCVYLFAGGQLPDRWNRLLITLLGGFYVGYLFPHWILLFRQPRGRAWVFWLLSVIMIGDTTAYFIGRRFGARKLAPEISPGKTVAGAWGYMAGAIVAGLVGAAFLFDQFAWIEMLGLSLVIGVLGQIGDLFESWIKRVFAVKDSGSLLPGHGGLLDRLDSLMFPAVFTTTYLKVFHP